MKWLWREEDRGTDVSEKLSRKEAGEGQTNGRKGHEMQRMKG
jgi:hypothetical protein